MLLEEFRGSNVLPVLAEHLQNKVVQLFVHSTACVHICCNKTVHVAIAHQHPWFTKKTLLEESFVEVKNT